MGWIDTVNFGIPACFIASVGLAGLITLIRLNTYIQKLEKEVSGLREKTEQAEKAITALEAANKILKQENLALEQSKGAELMDRLKRLQSE